MQSTASVDLLYEGFVEKTMQLASHAKEFMDYSSWTIWWCDAGYRNTVEHSICAIDRSLNTVVRAPATKQRLAPGFMKQTGAFRGRRLPRLFKALLKRGSMTMMVATSGTCYFSHGFLGSLCFVAMNTPEGCCQSVSLCHPGPISSTQACMADASCAGIVALLV